MSIQEKDIKGSPDLVSISCTQTILNQLKNCICKLKNNNTTGTGFFCTIPFGTINTMNCLVTNYHVLNEQYYDKNNKITLLLDDDNSCKILDLTKERKTYFDNEYDIALIELIDSDKIEYFLELDDMLKKEISLIEETYKNNSVYIIQYPQGKKAHVSYGIIKQINEFKIKHLCCTKNGSSGSPILNLENNKIIGIHTYASQNDNFNGGTLLKIILGNITYKTKQNQKSINDKIDETNTIKESDYNQGSWMYIFNQIINDYQYEKKNLTENEINEIVKEKIIQIKVLHKIFKIFIGVKENLKRKSSIENILNLMTSSIIGIKTFDGDKESDFIDFHAIEERIKNKIKNGSMIREQTDEKQNYKDINKQFFGDIL